MNESTTTTVQPQDIAAPLDRADLLAYADERLGDQIELFARQMGVIPAVARAIRRNKIQQIGDSVIDARRIADAARAAQALE